MKNGKLSRLIDDNRFLWLISILISIGLWSYVVVYISNQHTATIHNVPINLQYRSAVFQSMGLDVIESDISTVNVSVTGPRSVIGDLTEDDIVIFPNVASVDGRGTYTLALTAEPASAVKNFTITSLSKENVNIRLDKVISKQFGVETDISSITVGEGLMADRATATPAQITVTGPEYKVSLIKRVVATTLANETLTQSSVLPGVIRLYDENGGEIDHSLLSFDKNTLEITIPIMKEVTLPLKVEYVNAPSGFDTDTLKLSLSINEIHIAVPAKDASSLTEFVAGYIDLATLHTDQPYVLDIKLPTGYRSMDDVTQVNATISSENLTERVINVDEIKILNDANGSIQVLTQIISNVSVVGEKEAVDRLSSGSIIAQIDATRISAAHGQQTVEVSFIIPSTDKAYVKGVYTATIKI